MAKADKEDLSGGRQRKNRRTKFKESYDESFSREDMEEMKAKKKKGKRQRQEEKDW